VRTDELLEGGDLAGLRVVQADERDVPDIGDAVEAPQGRGRQVAVGRPCATSLRNDMACKAVSSCRGR
jgi:hypothetical protein